MSTNPVITLEANSLYIATSQIFGELGKFHWILYLTDAAGVATELQWVTLEANHPSGKWEGVVIETVDQTTTYLKNYAVVFAYMKVKGFTSPGLEPFKKVALEAFPEDKRLGYATLQENRAAGLTCRTWVLYVLSHIQDAGWLQRKETPQWFEETVKSISVGLEQEVERGELNASHVLSI